MATKQACAAVALMGVSMACTSEPAPIPTLDAAITEQPDGGDGCAPLTLGNCGIAYDCVNLEAATVKWLAQCDAYTTNVRREGCGYDILEHHYGEGDTLLAFYHPQSGDLKGWWHRGDTGGAECAGVAPEGCREGVSAPNVCESADTGAPSSEGPDSSVSSSEAGIPDSGHTTSEDGGLMGTLPDGGQVACCKISKEPDCCMHFGGADLFGDGCGLSCDGMALPNEAWTRGVDRYGCPVWVEPPRTNDCCGCPTPNETSAPDAGSDSKSGSIDASSPPASPDAASVASDASLDAAP